MIAAIVIRVAQSVQKLKRAIPIELNFMTSQLQRTTAFFNVEAVVKYTQILCIEFR